MVYFANGGSSYLERQTDMECDNICIDWGVDLDVARARLGPKYAVSGNIDPMTLFAPEKTIREEVRNVIMKGASTSQPVSQSVSQSVSQAGRQSVSLQHTYIYTTRWCRFEK